MSLLRRGFVQNREFAQARVDYPQIGQADSQFWTNSATERAVNKLVAGPKSLPQQVNLTAQAVAECCIQERRNKGER